MRYFIGILLIGIATAADAQRTTCTTIGNTVNCDTQQDAGPDWKLLQQPQPSPMSAYQAGRQAAAQQQQSNAKAEMTEIWVRCRKRWNEALEKRDFELADALVKGCPATP